MSEKETSAEGIRHLPEGPGLVKEGWWNPASAPVAVGSRAAVIGAGIAGVSVARALADRGIEVEIVDAGSGLGAGASGNHRALAQPFLGTPGGTLTRFHDTAFARSRAIIEGWGAGLVEPCGAVQFPATPRVREAFEAPDSYLVRYGSRLESDRVPDFTGVAVESAALALPTAFMLDPVEVLRAALDAPVTVRLGRAVRALSRVRERWMLGFLDGSSAGPFDLVVVANGIDAKRLPGCGWLSIEPVAGQLLHLDASTLARMPICFDGYYLPPREGIAVLGASYRHREGAPLYLHAEEDELIGKSARFVPGVARDAVIGGRTSVRVSTFDRLPFVGPIPDLEGARAIFTGLPHGGVPAAPLPLLPGLFAALGFGSRGFSVAPYAGELLAGVVCGGGDPTAAAELHPGRIIKRLWRRRDPLIVV